MFPDVFAGKVFGGASAGVVRMSAPAFGDSVVNGCGGATGCGFSCAGAFSAACLCCCNIATFLALFFAFDNAGDNSAASTAMMATTTSASTSRKLGNHWRVQKLGFSSRLCF